MQYNMQTRILKEILPNKVRFLYSRVDEKSTFRSKTDRIYDGGPIRLHYYYNYQCVTIAYSVEYSNTEL